MPHAIMMITLNPKQIWNDFSGDVRVKKPTWPSCLLRSLYNYSYCAEAWGILCHVCQPARKSEHKKKKNVIYEVAMGQLEG